MKFLILLLSSCAVFAQTNVEKTQAEALVTERLRTETSQTGARINQNLIYSIHTWKNKGLTGTNILITFVDSSGKTNRWWKGQ